MGFEWEEGKRRKVLAERGIDLRDMIALFDGRPVVSFATPRGAEARWTTVGLIEGRFFAVVWTRRDDNTRLITARGRGMAKKGTTVGSVADGTDAKLSRGGRTDWARVDATTQEEVERQIAGDPDLAVPVDWEKTLVRGLPFPLPKENKQPVTIRLDPQIVEHFKRSGRGWQSRINAVLRSYVESTRR
jgi:uncharacterized protein